MPRSPSPTNTSPRSSVSNHNLHTPSHSTSKTSSIFEGALPAHTITRPGLEGHGRRISVQFSSPGIHLPTGSPKHLRPNAKRRLSSPPPPDTFQNRVSFDTFDNKDATDFSLTLNCKHKDFQYSRRSRIFLCGLNKDEYSEYALEWLIDELIEDGDEIVCLRVVEEGSKMASENSKTEGRYSREARKMMDWVIEKNTEEKAISLVLEFAVGKVPDIIQRMIQVYEPAILIVGTRGKSLGGIQGLLPGSVSKYCLQHSPVPVIVVRPSDKREKKRSKRQKAATRGSYLDILERSGARGSHVLDRANRDSIVPEMSLASEQEAEAVAAAIGLPPVYEKLAGAARLSSRRSSLRSDSSLMEEQSPIAPGDGSESPGVVMKSPTMGTLESDPPSDAELESSDDDDEDDERGRGSTFEVVPGSLLHTHDVATDDESDAKKKARAEHDSGSTTATQALGDDEGGGGGGVKLDAE